MGSMIIVYRGDNKEYERPELGRRYIIHKAKRRESPGWVTSMNKYDGCIIEINHNLYDARNRVDKCCWVASPVDKPYRDETYYFSTNWLEKIDNFCGLDESVVNFFDI